MRKPRRGAPRFGGILLAAAAFLPLQIMAQEAPIESAAGAARTVASEGTAVILEAEGPPLDGPREFFYRASPPFDVSSRWVLVQDSTFGVVFSAPSGVKAGIQGYLGDLYLRALADVRAVEVRSLVFNIWGEYEGQLAVTVLVDRAAGERWEIHPSWNGVTAPVHEHRTSIVWIHRVMFDDESIVEADLGPVGRAWEHVTGSDFEGLTGDPPIRAVGR